jgi:hypothetical protein
LPNGILEKALGINTYGKPGSTKIRSIGKREIVDR